MIFKSKRKRRNLLSRGSMVLLVGIGLYLLVKRLLGSAPAAPAGNMRDFLEGLTVGLAIGSLCYEVVLRRLKG